MLRRNSRRHILEPLHTAAGAQARLTSDKIFVSPSCGLYARRPLRFQLPVNAKNDRHLLSIYHRVLYISKRGFCRVGLNPSTCAEDSQPALCPSQQYALPYYCILHIVLYAYIQPASFMNPGNTLVTAALGLMSALSAHPGQAQSVTTQAAKSAIIISALPFNITAPGT
jgi:hypothetical protein